jgi:hypothetical protein
MQALGKGLFWFGLGLSVLGALIWGLGRIGFRGLPGDIDYQGERVRVIFPLATSLVVSLLLTLGFWLWQRFMRR